MSVHNEKTIIQLHGEMTIYDTQQCKTVLLEKLKEHQVLILDLSKVDEMDTAGVQILISLVRTAKQMGRSLTILDAGQSLANIAQLCNLAHDLGLKVD